MATFTQQGIYCSVSGRLDQDAVLSLWNGRSSILDPDTAFLQLSGIEYCDSAGVAFLLELVSIFATKGATLKLISPSEQLKKFILLYDLNDFFIEEAK
ncbi:STAS domain-containing protein [Shewanella schlegeliana]|uniref:STAS domain-containing protein n=1 Tax=Shewanella schlegeliana TaxID=190308 RepID=A0ABS1SZ86_9GAMM|nr:STAS domain-containing protein [Shewanella schlegeliana]MBL4912857.1 STAS domain-containing protein [Shewanella schlegeliana]MCL1109046.1 STAS domain-containing protein [Shewanella schlegeliana]GIU23224.1 ABC phospholipid uptake (salvage) system anti-anti-sigma factor MlaB [Shewanella schlegeliana]